MVTTPARAPAPSAETGMKNPDQPWLAVGTADALPRVPVQWDGDEPYLQVASIPHVRITPFRVSDQDVAELVSLFNDPRVEKYAYGRPVPYTRDAARARIASLLPSAEMLETLRNPASVVDECPFAALRIRTDDAGTGPRDRLIGDIQLWDRADGRGVAGLRYNLDPAFQGRGIMRAAAETVLGWCGRGMEVEKVEAYTETGNTASAALLQRMGFEHVATSAVPWPVASGGGTRDVNVWQRVLPTPAPWIAVRAPPPPAPTIGWDDDGEGFMDLGDGFRVTPYRDTATEIAELVELSNHPSVSAWTYTRPYPYLESDARSKLDANVARQTAAVERLRAGQLVDMMPFTVIRDAEGRHIGDVTLYEVPPRVGGPEAAEIRELSYTLHPEYHGRGLGTRAAMAALGFMAAHMPQRRLIAYTQLLNKPSGGVLTKLGFVVAEERGYKWAPSKGGGWRECAIWQRELGPVMDH